MGEKIKVLMYCDSPTCATGFGTVSRNIAEALHKTGRYEIDIFGINYFGDPHPLSKVYDIWPAGVGSNDPYGRQKFCNMAINMDFDILFVLQDTFIVDFMPELVPFLRTNRQKEFRVIQYFPVDGVPKPEWMENINFADYKVAYSEFGKSEALKALPALGDIDVIPHGANINDYHYIPEEKLRDFKKQFFGKHADKFIIMNLNRNQQRKDIPRTIAAFKEFRKEVPESILYLHMAKKDQGWDLSEVCKSYGLNTFDDVIFPENFNVNTGYPREIVNALYNCADVVVSTALGEGMGMSWLEAMATKTPVIMPNNTAMTEFITSDKGYLVDSGVDVNMYTVLPHDNEVIRPLCDVKDLVDKLLHVYNNRDEAMARAETSYRWVTTEMDWQGPIAEKWVSLFDKAYEDLKQGSESKTSNESNGSITTETF